MSKQRSTVARLLARQAEAIDAARPLCPDHRDKQRGKPCLACTVETLERENARLRGESACDACGGSGVPASGAPCMCGGTGRATDAVCYLREMVSRYRKAIETAPHDAYCRWLFDGGGPNACNCWKRDALKEPTT